MSSRRAEVGAKVEGVWVAVKTDAAPANYKIDAATLTIDNAQEEVTFSLSKPTAGWPVGTYQVELTARAAEDGAFECARSRRETSDDDRATGHHQQPPRRALAERNTSWVVFQDLQAIW